MKFQIAFPPGFYNDLYLDAFNAAFQVALDMTHAKGVHC